jgi:hypothetical protein
MPEYFDKYREFERRQTNKTIDSPVEILWSCTGMELAIGSVFLVAGIYMLSASVVNGLILLSLGVGAPMGLRWNRENLPKNTFVHIFWLVGLIGKDLPVQIRRPNKFHMGP